MATFTSFGMFLATVLFITLLCASPSLSAPVQCPDGCTCEADKVSCANLTTFPNITRKDEILELTIKNLSAETIAAIDLEGFTSLQMLEITSGSVMNIAVGAFTPISSTISKIDLSHNKIESLPEGVFKNLGAHTIDLTGNMIETVTVKSFVELPNLQVLILTHNMISSIKRGAFERCDQLQTLNLLQNKFKTMPINGLNGLVGLENLRLMKNNIYTVEIDDTDTTLPALKDLALTNNPIFTLSKFPKIHDNLETLTLSFTHLKKILKGAWANLKNLKTLILSSNNFEYLEVGMFDGLESLETLDLLNMRSLTTIGPDAFHGLHNIKVIDLSGSHFLTSIDDAATVSVTNTLRRLRMTDCAVTYIPKALADWKALNLADIKGNPIQCDCKMKWAKEASNFGTNTDVKTAFENLVCETPKALFNKTLKTADPDLMKCESLDDHSSRVVNGIVVAVCCFIFMATIAVVAANRKRIYLWCRRQYQYRRYRSDMVFTVEQDTSVAELEDQIEARPLKDLKLEL